MFAYNKPEGVLRFFIYLLFVGLHTHHIFVCIFNITVNFTSVKSHMHGAGGSLEFDFDFDFSYLKNCTF